MGRAALKQTQVSERPIVFNDEMIRAILSGRKTQTRRPIKQQPKPYKGGIHPSHTKKHDAPYIDAYCGEKKTARNPRGMGNLWCWWTEDDRMGPIIGYCPYGKPGDHLWVRETWAAVTVGEGMGYNTGQMIIHRASSICGAKWKPSTCMPRRASRIILEITEIRVERIQDITIRNIWAEGVNHDGFWADDRYAFSGLWHSIYDKKGFGWHQNPWVWVIEFKVISKPDKY